MDLDFPYTIWFAIMTSGIILGTILCLAIMQFIESRRPDAKILPLDYKKKNRGPRFPF